MKKILVTMSVIISSIALTAGVVCAAGFATDWLRVGQQGTGGVTYFNGTILNETTGTGGVDNPVTFGDNVRIDGRVYRGATAGTGDTMPFIVNDNMEVAGDLTVTGNIAYSNSTSGLASTSVQGAIDELGVELSNLISGGEFTSAGKFNKSALSETTWTGYVYDVIKGEFRTSSEVTVTFTPTTDSSGTWASTPFNAFYPYEPSGGNVDYYIYALSGNYNIIGDTMFISGMEGWMTGLTSRVALRGNTITFYNTRTDPETVTVLTRQ